LKKWHIARTSLLNSSNSNSLEFYGGGEKIQVQLTSEEESKGLIFFNDNEKPRLVLRSSNSANNLILADKEGHERAVLGTTDLTYRKTGTTERTSESTLTLFDNKLNCIGRFPLWNH
jgi:hypothetical protein